MLTAKEAKAKANRANLLYYKKIIDYAEEGVNKAILNGDYAYRLSKLDRKQCAFVMSYFSDFGYKCAYEKNNINVNRNRVNTKNYRAIIRWD